jgi:predicted nucleotide-binding protein
MPLTSEPSAEGDAAAQVSEGMRPALPLAEKEPLAQLAARLMFDATAEEIETEFFSYPISTFDDGHGKVDVIKAALMCRAALGEAPTSGDLPRVRKDLEESAVALRRAGLLDFEACALSYVVVAEGISEARAGNVARSRELLTEARNRLRALEALSPKVAEMVDAMAIDVLETSASVAVQRGDLLHGVSLYREASEIAFTLSRAAPAGSPQACHLLGLGHLDLARAAHITMGYDLLTFNLEKVLGSTDGHRHAEEGAKLLAPSESGIASVLMREARALQLGMEKTRHVANRMRRICEIARVRGRRERDQILAEVESHRREFRSGEGNIGPTAAADAARRLNWQMRLEACEGLAGALTATPREIPKIFVGCSSEGLSAARAIQYALRDYQVVPWPDDRRLGEATIEHLERVLDSYNFGVFVFTADDTRISRGRRDSVGRDNVVLELGMFIARWGRERALIVAEADVVLPTDVRDVQREEFRFEQSGDEPALGPVCTALRKSLRRLFPPGEERDRPDRGVRERVER